METNTRIIVTLEIPDNPDALIQIYDRPYVSYQDISLTEGADIYFTRILNLKQL